MDHHDLSAAMSDEAGADLDEDMEDEEETEMSSKSNLHVHQNTHGTTVDSHLQDALEAVVAAASSQNAADGVGTSASNSEPSYNSGKKRHYFLKELRCMMYGFGDDKQPYTESVELLEDIVVEFIKNFTSKALDVGKTGKLQLEDVWYLIRRDPKKYCRVKDLLTMNEELRKARKAFDEAKY